MAEDLPVQYFSYGSNLSRANFCTRYKDFGGNPISYTRARKATLRDWTLTFNGFFCPHVDPVMASIERSPGALVDGILYEIPSATAWAGILMSEGGRGVYYDVIHITVDLAEDGTPVRAATLMITPLYNVPARFRSHIRPSARYVGLIKAGAEAEKLDRLSGRIKTIRPARKEHVFLQSVALLGNVWLIFVSGSVLRFTMRPFCLIGLRLFYAKERLHDAREGSVLNSVAYYAVSLALLQLTLVYAWGGLWVIALSGTARRMFLAMFKRMVTR